MKRLAIPMLGGLVLVAAARSAPSVPDGIYFFFTPRSSGIERIAAKLGAVEVRPVLLVEDARQGLPASFIDAVKALGRPLSVVDPEGVALARTLGVTRVPCLVRVHHGRVHAASGADLPVEEVLTCSR